MTTSTIRWGATPVSSVVCPMPQGKSYAQVKAAYDIARKANPQLTPAAWRKAAAQSLGMDYKDFLAIWKTKGKTAKVAESVATTPAPKVVKTPYVEPKPVSPVSAQYVDQLLDGPTAVKSSTGDGFLVAFGNGDELKDFMKLYGDTLKMEQIGPYHLKVLGKIGDGPVKSVNSGPPVKKAAAKPPPKPVKTTTTSTDVGDLPMTPYGKLDYNLAKSAYAKVKADMPGATPAQIRKAAANYLGVDYNDYLKAWKSGKGKAVTTAAKKPTPVKKDINQTVTQTSDPKMPNPYADPPLKDPIDAKWAKDPIDTAVLKQDIAKLYGPNGNPNYIDLVPSPPPDGAYTLKMPQSLLDSQAQKAIAEQLKRMGLKVDHKGGNAWKITGKKPPPPKGIVKGKLVTSSKTRKTSRGDTTLDPHAAETKRFIDDWWNGLSYDQKVAWERYTGPWYRDINEYLRHGKTLNPNMSVSKIKTFVKDIEDTMLPIDEPITVFRNTHIDINQFAKGRSWSDKGLMSTTVNESGVFGGTKFIITLPKGTKGMFINHKSSHPGEQEYLLASGTKFRVTSVDKPGNTVYLTAIP